MLKLTLLTAVLLCGVSATHAHADQWEHANAQIETENALQQQTQELERHMDEMAEDADRRARMREVYRRR